MGALNCYQVLEVAGLLSRSVWPILRTWWHGNSKLKHSEVRTAVQWGRMDDRLPNGAASKANRNVVQPLRRIRMAAPPVMATARTRHWRGLARLRTSTQGNDVSNYGEHQDGP